jgi:energy-converting hydrogenase Eha subunit E
MRKQHLGAAALLVTLGAASAVFGATGHDPLVQAEVVNSTAAYFGEVGAPAL